jgi:hypothetical protein
VRFYKAALAALGRELCSQVDSSASFRPAGVPALHVAKGAAGPSLHHPALQTSDHAAVDRFHKSGLKAGRRDHGSSGRRADYGPAYHAVFLLDPDGHHVEAVCRT